MTERQRIEIIIGLVQALNPLIIGLLFIKLWELRNLYEQKREAKRNLRKFTY